MEEDLDEGLRSDIKRRILLDIKGAGRRLGTTQMLERYAVEGEIAISVIDELVAKGILIRDQEQPLQSMDDLIHAVSSFEYTIEDQVKRALRDSVHGNRLSHRESRRELRAAYRADRAERRSEWHLERDVSQNDTPDAYEVRICKERNSSIAGLISHSVVFIGVNAFLMFLNAAFSPSFPWALIPFGGWGIGLLNHLVSSLRKQKRLAEFRRLPIQSEQGLGLFKKLQKIKNSYWLNLSSTVSTSAFLIMLNGITMRPGPGFFPWAAIPVFFMFLSLIERSFRFVWERRELNKSLQIKTYCQRWMRMLNRYAF